MIEIIGRGEVPKGTNKSFCIIRIVGIDCDKFVITQLENNIRLKINSLNLLMNIVFDGAPGAIRTPDLLNRNPVTTITNNT